MSFIAVPKEKRFITKTWVDLFFWAVGIAVADVLITLFSRLFGSLLDALSYMFIIILVILATLLTSTYIAGKRLQTFAP